MSSRLTCASSNTSPVSVLAVSTSYDRYVVFGGLLGARELASLTVTAFAGHLKLCSHPVRRGARRGRKIKHVESTGSVRTSVTACCVISRRNQSCLCGVITFCVSRRRRKMYCGHARLCVCLSVCPRP